MKIIPDPNAMTKLCHARPGDVVQLLAPDGSFDSASYLIAVASKKCVPETWHSSGLYGVDSIGAIWLINLSSGIPRQPPSLSQRVIIYRNAEVHLNKEYQE
jgi:hypothetical protein